MQGCRNLQACADRSQGLPPGAGVTSQPACFLQNMRIRSIVLFLAYLKSLLHYTMSWAGTKMLLSLRINFATAGYRYAHEVDVLNESSANYFRTRACFVLYSLFMSCTILQVACASFESPCRRLCTDKGR